MKVRLRGRIKINASGRELFSFINCIHSMKINIYNQYCRKDVLYADILKRDLKKIRSIAEKYSIELKTAEYISFSEFIHRYRKRTGIIIGAVAVLLGTVYLSQIVVSIEIQGNTAVSEEKIISALGELGIKKGAFIKSVDMHYCENELRLMVDGVSWAGIRHTGNRVVVQITETAPKPEMLLERVPCNIVSSKDAEITSVSVLDGMLMHKVGDYVPKGTLLVSGVAEDDTGHMTVHHANGSIKGIYTENVSFSCEYHKSELTRTGRHKKKRYLRLFNLEIPLFIGRNKYENSERESTEYPVSFFGRKLPLSVVTTTEYETVLSEIIHDNAETEKILVNKIYNYEQNFLSDTEILSRKIRKTQTDSAVVFNVEYKVNGEIGWMKDIFFYKQD